LQKAIRLILIFVF